MDGSVRTTCMIWNQERRKRIAIALGAAMLISLPLGFISHEGSAGLLQAGDFPGFYVLPEILSRGEAQRLYDPVLQHQIQSEFWPAFKDSYYHSVYPPFVAFFLYPLVIFGPHFGQLVWTMVSAACLFFALKLLSTARTVDFYLKFILLLIAGPGFYAVFGAQNSAFTTLFLALVMIASKRCSDEKLAALKAVLAGVLIYKPQFGILVSIALGVNYLVIAKKERGPSYVFFSVAVVCAFAIFLLSTSILGPRWLPLWLEAVQKFSHQNYIANYFNQISIVGVLSILNAGKTSIFLLMSPAIAAMVWVGAQWQKRKILLIPLLTLLSPQTLFYDMLLPLTLFMAHYKINSDRKFTFLILAAVIVGVLTGFRESFGAAPLAVINLAVFSYFWNIYKEDSTHASS